MSSDQKKQKRNRILSWLINLAGILVFVLLLYFGGIEAWEQIVAGDWRYVLAAFAVTLLWNLAATYRWSLIADQVTREPEPCPFRYYFTYHMMGMISGQVMPITVGMLGGRPVALSLSREVPLRRATLSVFLDKLFDLILALLLVLPVAFFLINWIGLALALGLMIGAVIAGALLLGWQYEGVVRLAGRLAGRLAQPLDRLPVVGLLASRLARSLARLSVDTFLTNRRAVQSFLLTVVMYGLLAARLFFVAQALRLEIPWYLMAMGVCVAQLTLVFSITPGSLGFLEAGWGAVLSLAGLGPDQIVFFLIARRAYMLVFTLILTLSAFAWIRESPARLFRAVLDASRRPGPGQGEDPSQPGSQNGSPSSAVK